MGRSKIDRNANDNGKSVSDYLIELYDKFGGSQVKVAAHIGISQPRLSQFLKERGLKEKTILIKEMSQCSN